MSKRSIVLLVFVIMSLFLIVYYNTDSVAIKERMMNYAIEKYGKDFTEVYFNRSDGMYAHHTLSLMDEDGLIFNVIEDSVDFRYDDYLNSIADNMVKGYIKDYLGSDLNGCTIGVMSDANIHSSVEDIQSISFDEYMREYKPSSLVFVCNFNGRLGSIYDKSEVLLRVNKKLHDLDFDVIDFNIVVTSGYSEDVNNVISNMRCFYSLPWYSCSFVEEYVECVGSEPIRSREDLYSMVCT